MLSLSLGLGMRGRGPARRCSPLSIDLCSARLVRPACRRALLRRPACCRGPLLGSPACRGLLRCAICVRRRSLLSRATRRGALLRQAGGFLLLAGVVETLLWNFVLLFQPLLLVALLLWRVGCTPS